jgi:CheY-like chemotaxis protein
MRILLIEDDENDAKLMLSLFHKDPLAHRMTIHLVEDGKEALAYLFGEDNVAGDEGRRPHLILLDLRLPNVDGMEVLRRAKSDPRTRRIPVVVITGMPRGEQLAETYDLGVNSYVVKSPSNEEFAQTMAMVCEYWTRLNEPPTF